MARIELVRSGGFAGLSLQASVDTTEAAEDPEAAWFAEQVAALDLPALAAAPAGEPGPDRYRYALSVQAEDGARHELEFGEAALPSELAPLVDALVARARSGPRRA